MPGPVAFKAVFYFVLTWFSPIYLLYTFIYDNYGLYELDDVKIHQIPMDFRWILICSVNQSIESLRWLVCVNTAISCFQIWFLLKLIVFFSLDEICKSTGMLIIKLIVRAQSIDLAMILLSQSISMWNVFNSISTIHTIKILITSMEFNVINKLSMNILMTFQKRVFIHVAAGKERREKERENGLKHGKLPIPISNVNCAENFMT